MNAIFSESRWLRQITVALSVGALTAAYHANAAPAKLKVTGTINPSTTCTASLSTAQLSYGDIPLSELSQSKPTALATKPLSLNVACAPFASKFYFRIIERAYNNPYVPEDLGGAAGVPLDERIVNGLGLGMTAANRPLGELFLKSTAIQADGQTKLLLQKYASAGDGSAWSTRKSDFLWGNRDGTRHYIVADPVDQITTAAKKFTIQMDTTPVISPSAIKGLSTDAQLNGKFTIEIHQL